MAPENKDNLYIKVLKDLKLPPLRPGGPSKNMPRFWKVFNALRYASPTNGDKDGSQDQTG